MQRPIERAWELQQRWSTAANAAHARIDCYRRWNLALLVLAAIAGAVGGAFNEQSSVVRTMAVLSAALLGTAGFIQQRFLRTSDIGQWLETRNASERLKADIWRALGRGNADDPPTEAALLATIDAVQTNGAAGVDVLESVSARPLPDVPSFDDYRQLRADDQATWHRGKVDTLRTRAKLLRTVELGVTVVGLIVSAIAAAATDVVLTPIVSALTTVAAAIAAHLSASKYERIAAGYATTTLRLETLLVTLPDEPSEGERVAFVDAIEIVLEQQNDDWTTLLSED